MKNGVLISVIVPARDAAATLSATLDGLASQQLDAPFEVIVVDNGSNDETAAVAERHRIAPRVIRRQRGEGAGAARNDGVAASSGEVLAFVDSDCAPTPTWLAEGLRELSQADLVAGAVRPPDGIPVGPFDRTLWVTREHGLYQTANLFVRREWFDRLGGFQDWVPERGAGGAQNRPFGEDAWFGWRARRMGARTTFGPTTLVHHAVFPGTAAEAIAEQWRLRYFPALFARIPELRHTFAWNRLFITKRSAAFDLALAGAITAAALRSFISLAAAVPYAVLVAIEASGWRRRGRSPLKLALYTAVHDAVSFAALLVGSVRARTLLI